MKKICTKCKQELDITNFCKDTKNKDGLQYWCRECLRVYNTNWRNAHPNWYRKYWRRNKLGVTKEDYAKLLETQKGCCAICGRRQQEFKRHFALDHNHNTLQVRGLLCPCCNTLLGLAKDSKHLLNRAIDYLNKHDN